jgi:hypothetical protein
VSGLVCAAVLAGCAPFASACRPGEQAAIHDLLYFGTLTTDGIVTPVEWADFVERTITPRFPQGLTTWDAAGQWRTADGRVIREGTHVLSVAHPDDAAAERAVVEIVAAYRARFAQEGVFRIRTIACTTV